MQIYSAALVNHVDKSMVPFFAGGFAATTFWTCAFPCDVIKNRMMNAGGSIVSNARKVYSERGI
jgi:Mitochondrial carrier protein